ncbi:hypothetical protein S1OALGB6SA_1506, partial [Olavius algarvensis spirochete endosymbiont]
FSLMAMDGLRAGLAEGLRGDFVRLIGGHWGECWWGTNEF